MRVALLFLIAFLALAGSGGLAAERLVLKPAEVGTEYEFLDKLVRTGAVRVLDPKFDFDDIGVGRFDLDGDGNYELLVGFDSGVFCGRSECPVHIYKRIDRQWTWVGGLWVPIEGAPVSFGVFVEAQIHNGWRVLSNGEYSTCWVRTTGRKSYHPWSDPTGKDREPGMAGYFWSVKRGEPCPDD
ncbi:MAG: hypothetical protein FJX46_16975 [Alphaproteobacteria bacterium]|nr:hypothetical protein [Alphaproteobacteria bacterium]